MLRSEVLNFLTLTLGTITIIIQTPSIMQGLQDGNTPPTKTNGERRRETLTPRTKVSKITDHMINVITQCGMNWRKKKETYLKMYKDSKILDRKVASRVEINTSLKKRK